MDDFLKQIYPEGKERWVKVKYTNSDKAIEIVRLESSNFKGQDLGFEIVSIGIRDEHFPQVEALIELKAEFQRDPIFLASSDSETLSVVINNIDIKIEKILNEVLLTK